VLAVLLAAVLPLTGCDGLMLMDEILYGPSGSWLVSGGNSTAAPAAYADATGSRPERPARGPGSEVDDQQAWRLLEQRSYAWAASQFTSLIDRHPGDGRPVLGYALAVASSGDLACGEDAIRWVLRRDPGALDRVPSRPRVRRRAEVLTARYHEQLPPGGADRRALLTLAALYYVAGDEDSARSAASLARRLGDQSVAAINMLELLGPAPSPPFVSAPAPRSASPPPVAAEPVPPIAVREPATASAAVEQPATALPGEPVDYDRLRDELMEMSDALDRFTRKLLGAMAESGAGGGDPGQARADVPTPATEPIQ
jgi:hypothetical protein